MIELVMTESGYIIICYIYDPAMHESVYIMDVPKSGFIGVSTLGPGLLIPISIYLLLIG